MTKIVGYGYMFKNESIKDAMAVYGGSFEKTKKIALKTAKLNGVKDKVIIFKVKVETI